MRDFLSEIKQPIVSELGEFTVMFNAALEHDNGVLRQALEYIKQRNGKRMRPM